MKKIILYFAVAFLFTLSAEGVAQTKKFADRGIFEIGGRLDFSYLDKERGAGLGHETQGNFSFAPQLGYFLTANFEVSVLPTVNVNFYDNRATETLYGAMLAPAYVLPYLRPFYPYIEGLVGSTLSKNNQTVSWGVGTGIKILVLENALLKLGFTYLNNNKTSRVDSSIYEKENLLNFSVGFGIFF
ncbi:MAG TPA: hypothetical protein PLY93_02580 [Turneriella sp.]|nr:hypothetical protein [Turneriella sp.]